MVQRFGIVAGGCTIALVFSGTVMAWQHLRALHDLVGTGYGQILSIKIVLFAGVVTVVFAGRRGIIPYPELWWKWELATLSGVLAAAALLASLPPAT